MAIRQFGEQEEIVPGTIIMWAGKLSNIPSGWVLCDGNNGTPNLIDRFVRSVPDATTDPGGTGGQKNYSLSTSQMPSHSHRGTTQNAGEHAHGGANVEYSASGGAKHGCDTSGNATGYTGRHSHTLSVGSVGSGNSIDNQPSYYEVAFIMKV